MPQYLSGKQLDLLHFKDFAIMEEQLKQVKNANKDIVQQLQSKDLIIKSLKEEIDSLKKTGKAAAPAAAQAAPEQSAQQGAKQQEKGNKIIAPMAWNVKLDGYLRQFHNDLLDSILNGRSIVWNNYFDLPFDKEVIMRVASETPFTAKIDGFTNACKIRLSDRKHYMDIFPWIVQVKVNNGEYQSLGQRFFEPEKRKRVAMEYSSIVAARGSKSAYVPARRSPLEQPGTVPATVPNGSSTASQETTSSASPEGSNGISEREQGDDASTNDSFLVSSDDDETLSQMLRKDPSLRKVMRTAGLKSDSDESDERGDVFDDETIQRAYV